MKLYLSSYNLGDKAEVLKDWIKTSKDNKIALIPNAGDFSTREIRDEYVKKHIALLNGVGFDTSVVDLQDYFGKEKELVKELQKYHAYFANGGNCFNLRQAMKLSGFDKYLLTLKDKDNYLYGGWSAGVCVLAKSMKGIELCDDPTSNPYNHPPIYEGIGLLDYLICPHYKSDHKETKMIDDVVAYMQKNNLLYKTLRDGEVIIQDTKTKETQIEF